MKLSDHPELEHTLDAFAAAYCENVFTFLYEVDIQVLLGRILDIHFSKKHYIQKEKNTHKSLENLTQFDIGKSHREYPPPIRFDNVILGSPKQIENISVDYEMFYESFYHQPIQYAIELKFVPLYQSGVLNADKSLDDYNRLIEKVAKLDYPKELDYALQLTLFQSLEEQEGFLTNHTSDKRPRWKEWFEDFKAKVELQDRIGYYYLDLTDKQVKPVFQLK